MKRRFSDKKRGRATRSRKPIMFLSLEGRNQTERIYLRAINVDYGEKFSLQYARGHKADVRGMWESLMALMEGVFSEADGDCAYCICDTDFEPYKLDKIKDVKSESKGTCAEVIVSNPSFELWFLNHFRFFARQFNSQKELEHELCKEIPGYEKNGDYYLRYLKARTNDAIENSNRQKSVVNEGDQESQVLRNASTDMAQVVQAILQER